MRVAIDLTSLRSGKENDDAEALVITLIKSFRNLRCSKKKNLVGYGLDQTRYQFILITAPWNHDELSDFESDHITCILAKDLTILRSYIIKAEYENLSTLKRFIRKAIGKILKKMEITVRTLKYYLPQYNLFLRKIKADILFSPLSKTTYADHKIPLVANIYNLQNLNGLKQLFRQARGIVCVSEFMRQSLMSHLPALPDQLTTIPVCIQDSFPRLNEAYMLEYLDQLKLGSKHYAFYPANHYPHKNYHLLLLAYSIYCSRLSEQSMDLVLTGVLPEVEQKLRDVVERMNLQGKVHFLCCLSEEALAAVWQGSFCLLFPPLYEEFGIPLLEAMRYGKPVVCSNVCSLPEVGGDAVLYFDPRKPEEIAACLERLERDSVLVEQLVWKGYQRLSSYRQQDMLNQYLTCFEEVISRK